DVNKNEIVGGGGHLPEGARVDLGQTCSCGPAGLGGRAYLRLAQGGNSFIMNPLDIAFRPSPATLGSPSGPTPIHIVPNCLKMDTYISTTMTVSAVVAGVANSGTTMQEAPDLHPIVGT